MQHLIQSWHIIFMMIFTVSVVVTMDPAKATQEAQQSASQEDEIVVTGQKKRMAEFQNLIINHFRVSGGGRNNGQYARFAQPVCPSVAGLAERQSKAIEDRIRAIAEMAEIEVAKEDCRPNIFVAVVEDGGSEIKLLRSKKNRLFGSLTDRERDKIEQSGGPVYSWKATQTLGSDSRHSANAGSLTFMADANGSGGGAALGGAAVNGQVTQVKSKISRSTVEGIGYSYLLIDSKALQGVSAAQLADYAAMVSLIDIQVGSDIEVPDGSILSLFSETEDKSLRPTSLSGGDLLLLRGLYKVPANVKASLQRSAMIHTMSEGLKNPERIDR
ncbi:hypothetical protein [Parasphingorhabdus sp.]|uniref:hypothetical protein n=1 Tax=Parasphingorhabdus sp. TaxID=2709688 RepID=UPI003001255F